MSHDNKAEVEDPLLQVCTERDLARIAKWVDKWDPLYIFLNVTGPEATAIKQNHSGGYEQQKIEVLKVWKCKRGLQATFKVLADVFSKELNDQTMVDAINTLATEASKESSEDLVIEHHRDLEQLGIDKLQAAVSSMHMITDTYSEAMASAANDKKKLEVIFMMLSHTVRGQLTILLEMVQQVRHLQEERQQAPQLSPTKASAAEGDSKAIIVSPNGARNNALRRTKLSNVDNKFRLTVKNIKKHLEHCDVQDLVTDFNISANDIPYFSDEDKKKLHKCATIKDLFVRLSPYISWHKRDVLRVLVEVSDCEAAVDELNGFEEWLDTSQPIMNYPIPQASSSICPDPNSDMTMIAMKANEDLKEVTYKDFEQYQDTVARVGKVSSKALDLQAANPGSSIFYWLLPKSVVKSFEENICNNLNYLYNQGIVEISFDPNIVITTDSKLRIRSLSYLTKIPPKRTEELELPVSQEEQQIEEIGEALVELAHQLKEDLLKRDKEIEVLQTSLQEKDMILKELEQDKKYLPERNEEIEVLQTGLQEKDAILKEHELDKVVKEEEIQSLKTQLMQSKKRNDQLRIENDSLKQELDNQLAQNRNTQEARGTRESDDDTLSPIIPNWITHYPQEEMVSAEDPTDSQDEEWSSDVLHDTT